MSSTPPPVLIFLPSGHKVILSLKEGREKTRFNWEGERYAGSGEGSVRAAYGVRSLLRWLCYTGEVGVGWRWE